MPGQGKHIHRQFRQVYRNMPHRLDSVSMEQHALFPADCADLRNGFDGTDLVVSKHHAHQAGVRSDSGGDLLRGDDTGFGDLQERHGKALFFQLFQRVENGVMLDHGRDNVFFALFCTGIGGRAQRLVVRLAAAGGEVNFPCRTAQAGGNVLASLEQCLSSCLSDVVDAGGIAVVLFHAGHHGLDCCLAGLCGGCIVCVYLQWDSSVSG